MVPGKCLPRTCRKCEGVVAPTSCTASQGLAGMSLLRLLVCSKVAKVISCCILQQQQHAVALSSKAHSSFEARSRLLFLPARNHGSAYVMRTNIPVFKMLQHGQSVGMHAQHKQVMGRQACCNVLFSSTAGALLAVCASC